MSSGEAAQMQRCYRSRTHAAIAGKNTAAAEEKNSAVRRQIFGGVGTVGYSAAVEFGGAGV